MTTKSVSLPEARAKGTAQKSIPQARSAHRCAGSRSLHRATPERPVNSTDQLSFNLGGDEGRMLEAYCSATGAAAATVVRSAVVKYLEDKGGGTELAPPLDVPASKKGRAIWDRMPSYGSTKFLELFHDATAGKDMFAALDGLIELLTMLDGSPHLAPELLALASLISAIDFLESESEFLNNAREFDQATRRDPTLGRAAATSDDSWVPFHKPTPQQMATLHAAALESCPSLPFQPFTFPGTAAANSTSKAA